MLTIGVCDKCGSNQLRQSRIRTLGGFLVSFLLIPYRCRICDHRQLKFRFVQPGGVPEPGEMAGEVSSEAPPAPPHEVAVPEMAEAPVTKGPETPAATP